MDDDDPPSAAAGHSGAAQQQQLGASPPAHRQHFPAFPYKPYDIQQGFMEALYESLERRELGLFESPTGTGKTISLICGALHWLEDHRQRAEQEREQASAARQSNDDGDPDWLYASAAAPAHETAVHPWRQRRGSQGPRTVEAAQFGASAQTGQGAANGARATAAAATALATSGTAAVAGPALELDGDGNDHEFLLPDPAGVTGAGGLRRTLGAAGGGGDGSSSSDDTDGGGGGGVKSLARQALRALRTPPPPSAAGSKVQVFFASRTHSQLAQFVGELRRTPFGSRLSLLCLASRKGLCVHEPVASLGSAHLINERCTELQESKQQQRGAASAPRKAPRVATAAGQAAGQGRGAGSKKRGAGGCGCPFLGPSLESAEGFAEAALGRPMDVEELGRLGRSLGICPYYATRSLLAEADIVALPYSALLSEETRGSLGIRLDGSVVIFDEAHNLVDAINGAHSMQVTLPQLQLAHRQLAAYFERFKLRLAPANARNVQLLLSALSKLQRSLVPPASPAPAPATPAPAPAPATPTPAAAVQQPPPPPLQPRYVASSLDFLLACHLDNINMFALLRWVRETRLVIKVAGYDLAAASAAATQPQPQPQQPQGAGQVRRQPQQPPQPQPQPPQAAGRAPLFSCIAFLASLTNADADGRVVVAPGPGEGARAGREPQASAPALEPEPPCLKYLLLDAAARFARVLASARSVVLASGTLAPVAGLAAQLFPGRPPERVRHYACGHVVPARQVLALVAARGPTGVQLDLRHGRRAGTDVMDEVGRMLLNLSQVVPAGLVAFAPSFAYLDALVARWQANGTWAALAARKQPFLEPRASGDVERLLTAYAAAVRRYGAGGSGSAADGSARGAASGGGPSPQPRQPMGALLLCVVGGKLSEGINFGDDLGRCVVVLGLPYPNPSDPELQERMRYLDARAAAAGQGSAAATSTSGAPGSAATAVAVEASAGPGGAGSSPPLPPPPQGGPPGAAGGVGVAGVPPRAGPQAEAAAATSVLTGRQYYQGLCVRAVNQTIGRVIRHAGDHAAIVLADARYLQGAGNNNPGAAATSVPGAAGAPALGGLLGQLPGWIQASVDTRGSHYGHVHGRLHAFFKGHCRS